MKTTKKKKTNMRTVIRTIVREEVAMAIQEVITELKQPSLSSLEEAGSETSPTPQQVISKPFEKKHFSKNSVLNDVLNETANGDWETMGGKEFTSDRMNDIVGKNYGDMMNSNPNTPVSVDGQTADFLKKDYRAVMKAIEKKKGK